MRIEVNDEVARLRGRETPIKCFGESGLDPAQHEHVDFPRRATRECDDCGRHMIYCRCNPGEG